MADAVLTDVANGIATLTLNKPWKLNAWDTPMRDEVRAALEQWNARDDVRAVIITGAGERAFSAGAGPPPPPKIPPRRRGGGGVLGPMLMVERLGLSRTIELTLTGRMMEAAEAKAVGLIHHLAARPEDVMPKALEIAAQLGSKPPIAMRLNKRWLRQMTQAAFDQAFLAGGSIQAEAYASGEPQETMRR